MQNIQDYYIDTTFKATYKGKPYNVKIKKPRLFDYSWNKNIDRDNELPWRIDAQIDIAGEWYYCEAVRESNPKDHTVTYFLVVSCNELQISQKEDEFICVPCENWLKIYEQTLENYLKEWTKIANEAVFTEIYYDYSCKDYCNFCNWNAGIDRDYVAFNTQCQDFRKYLILLNGDQLKKYCTGVEQSFFTYTIPVADFEKLKGLAAPAMKIKLLEKEKEAELNRKWEERNENIKNGAIYFRCITPPHDCDLTNIALTAPAPNEGLFYLTHEVSEDIFNRIKNYGRYFDAEFLDECDWFTLPVGWYYLGNAIEELANTHKVYINDEEYNPEKISNNQNILNKTSYGKI